MKLKPEACILKLLKDKPRGFLSGEEISSKLKMTRSAIWKHVESLRQTGFLIDAAPPAGVPLRRFSGPNHRR